MLPPWPVIAVAVVVPGGLTALAVIAIVKWRKQRREIAVHGSA